MMLVNHIVSSVPLHLNCLESMAELNSMDVSFDLLQLDHTLLKKMALWIVNKVV
jgi:hypothetical protein